MFEWHKLIIWFDILKQNYGVTLQDRFVIVNDEVKTMGDDLSGFMDSFWIEEGYTAQNYPMYHNGMRARLKAHLLAFLNMHMS